MPARIPARYPAHLVRMISVESSRDPRSVVAALDGTALPLTTSGVFAACHRLGIDVDSLKRAAVAS